jgi:hypothetical protein
MWPFLLSREWVSVLLPCLFLIWYRVPFFLWRLLVHLALFLTVYTTPSLWILVLFLIILGI